jgi:hypothetical protein
LPDYSHSLRQLVEKMLIHRGRRNATCRVFPPASGTRTYSVVLEESQVREQFFLDPGQVEQFGRTGNEQYVLTDVRSGVRSLDRLLTRKKTARLR